MIDQQRSGHDLVDIVIRDYTGLHGLAAIRTPWRSLLARLPATRFFDYPEWYESYLHHLEPDPASVRFVVAFQGQDACAIFPLKLAKGTVCGVQVTAWSLPRHAHMPAADFIGEERDVCEAMGALLAHIGRTAAPSWDVLRLSNVLEHSLALRALERGCSMPQLRAKVGAADRIPCASQSAVSARLSKNFKGNLRKAKNKLFQLPGVEFVSARTQPELGACFEEFLAVEASGWKGPAGTNSAIGIHAAIRGFYVSLMHRYAPSGGCEINLLRGDGRCLAGQFCLVRSGTTHVLKIGYDERYARTAPGNVLMDWLVQRCAADASTCSVDLVTDAAWHASWKPEQEPVFDACLFNSTLLGRTAFFLMKAKQRAFQKVA